MLTSTSCSRLTGSIDVGSSMVKYVFSMGPAPPESSGSRTSSGDLRGGESSGHCIFDEGESSVWFGCEQVGQEPVEPWPLPSLHHGLALGGRRKRSGPRAREFRERPRGRDVPAGGQSPGTGRAADRSKKSRPYSATGAPTTGCPRSPLASRGRMASGSATGRCGCCDAVRFSQ